MGQESGHSQLAGTRLGGRFRGGRAKKLGNITKKRLFALRFRKEFSKHLRTDTFIFTFLKYILTSCVVPIKQLQLSWRREKGVHGYYYFYLFILNKVISQDFQVCEKRASLLKKVCGLEVSIF